MRGRRSIGRALALAALVLAFAPPADGGPADPEAARRHREGREALKEGRRAVARHHLLGALALDPAQVDVVADLATLEGDDADARALWLLHGAFAAADGAAKGAKPKSWNAFPAAEAALALDLAAKRAHALRAVVDAAARLPADRGGPAARWLRALGADLAAGSVALAASSKEALDKAVLRCRPETAKVEAALETAMAQAGAEKRWTDVLAAARLVLGLARQRSQQPGGPQAGGGRGVAVAGSAIEQARAALRAAEAAPLSFDELLRVPDGAAWGDAHATWASPAVATTPGGLYRVESVCGWDTTRCAVIDLEAIHDRLARWTGRDPLRGRQGLVRLCSSWADIEQEGQPYWWAPGFASGDRVTVMVNFDDRDGLGRTLTHELCHRFDFALHAGLPAWAAEGRAVFVETCSPSARARQIDERLLSRERLNDAFEHVWGGPPKLAELLAGKNKEYRDNYPVGYALWLVLSRFRGFDEDQRGPFVFRSRLAGFLAGGGRAPGADPVAAFVAAFCDGAEGRPKGLEEFSRLFDEFLLGFWVEDTPKWTQTLLARHGRALERGAYSDDLRDKSNWPASRERLDPPETGEGLALEAGRLLERLGKKAEAVEAYEWAMAVDEPSAARCLHLAGVEEAAGQAPAGWALRALAHRLDPRLERPAGTPPGTLATPAQATAVLLDALRKAEEGARSQGRPRLARAMRADHDRIGAMVGRAPLPVDDPPLPAVTAEDEHGAPDCLPFTSALSSGLVEDRWSRIESEAGGLWSSSGPDLLRLGSAEGAARTGLERDAGTKRVFVRGRDVLGGTYTLRTHVRLVSAYVEAGVVLGMTRRDRGLAVSFATGDLRYALKKTSETSEAARVWVRIDDLRPYDGGLSELARVAAFDAGKDGFDLAVHVSGPYVRVQVNGRDVLSHRRTTGDPVEGFVGFALERGQVAFEDPVIARHRAAGVDARCRCETFDAPLSFARAGAFSWGSLVGRRVVGLPPSKRARMLLWGTGFDASDPSGAESIHEALDECRTPFVESHLPVDVHVAVPGEGGPGGWGVPAGFPTAEALAIPPLHLHAHHGHPTLEKDVEGAEQEHAFGWPRWVGILVDPGDVVRARGPWDGLSHGFRLVHRVEGR